MTFPAKAQSLFLWAIIYTLAVPIVCPPAARAQTARQTPETGAYAEKENEAQALEKKTLVLLNDLASASWSLKLPENNELRWRNC